MRNSIITIIIFLFSLFVINNNCSLAQIETATMKKLNIHLDNAYFQKASVYKLNIDAFNVNFVTGNIATLAITCLGLKEKDLILDEVNLTIKNVSFDSDSLFTKKELLLNQPVEGTFYIIVTENGLNTILNQPKVSEKLTNLATTKIKRFGINLSSGVISFKNPKARILANNIIQINMIASIASLIEFPITFNTVLNISDSRLVLVSPKIITSGITLPDDISLKINEKLNSLMDIGDQFEDDFEIKVTSLNVIPEDRIIINASALIKKLKFSKKSKANS